MSAIGATVAEKRLAIGLSVRGLMEESGVGSGFINDIEHGRGNPTLRTLVALSKGLGTDLAALLREAQVRLRSA